MEYESDKVKLEKEKIPWFEVEDEKNYIFVPFKIF